MDEFSQHLGNEWRCQPLNLPQVEDILSTELTFQEEAQSREFRELRANVVNESLNGDRAESSARRLIELVSTLPETHVAQIIIRLEAAKTFYTGDLHTEVRTSCNEALALLDTRARQEISDRRYDERLRLDLLELLAAACEFDGDDRAALSTWAQVGKVACSAVYESKRDPSFDEDAHTEFVEDILVNLSEGWFSSALSVPKSLKELQQETLQSLLSGVLDTFSSLLKRSIEPSELSRCKVDIELVPALSQVLYLYACHFSRAGDFLTAEKLLGHRFETLKECSSSAPSSEHFQEQHKALIDLIRTRIDRGACSLATESVKELFPYVGTLTQSELQATLGVVRQVIQHADEEDIALLAPLIRDQFKVTKFPRPWLGMVADLVEIAIDLRRMKFARKLLTQISQKIDLESDPTIKVPVKSSLLYSQINCLIKIDESFRLGYEVSPLAKELTEKLVTLLESSSCSFPDRNFHLMMTGIIMIRAHQGMSHPNLAATAARRAQKAINLDETALDARTLGATYQFYKEYFDIELSTHTEQRERVRDSFSHLYGVFRKEVSASTSLDLDLLTSLAVQFADFGAQYLTLTPSFTGSSQKVAARLYKILPALLERVDSEVMTVEVLTKKVAILSALVSSLKVLNGAEDPEYKEVLMRLQSARSALDFWR